MTANSLTTPSQTKPLTSSLIGVRFAILADMKPLTLTPSSPYLIVLMGIPGAGKTQFAQHFAKMFSAPFVNTRELQFVTPGISDEQAEALGLYLTEQIFRAQKTFIYEGPTFSYDHRVELAKRIKSAGFKPLLVWVQTESIEAKRRSLKSREYTSEQFAHYVQAFQPPLESEKPVVISGKHTFTTQVKMVLKHLASETRQQRPEPPKAPPRSNRIIVRR